jgi:hypothetical protein
LYVNTYKEIDKEITEKYANPASINTINAILHAPNNPSPEQLQNAIRALKVSVGGRVER